MNTNQTLPPQETANTSATSFAKNIVGAVLIGAWAILLIVLAFRMPISDLLAGLDILALDTVLSAIFIAVGIAAAICGLCFGSKPLMLLSLMQSLFLLCFAVTVCLYLVFFNGDILAVGLYFVNHFAALLSCPFSIFLIVSGIVVFLPLVVFLLYAYKKRRAQKNASALDARKREREIS